MQKYTHFEKVVRFLMYLVLILVAIVAIYPFWYVAIYALSDSNAAIEKPVLLIPQEPTLAVFKNLFSLKLLWSAYLNTVIVTFAGTLFAVILTTSLAYPLSVRRLKGRAVISFMMFFTMMFGGGMIPAYLLMKELGLLDTKWSIILPSMLNASNVLIMRSFFLSLPGELEESASIDGATPLKILIRIIIPISLPALAVQAMFYGIGYWNEYFHCLMYIETTSKLTLQCYLRTLLASSTAGQTGVIDISADTLSNETVRMGCVAVTIIPVLLVYPWLQKYYVKGMVVGSVKG